jgi:hypothetical protein
MSKWTIREWTVRFEFGGLLRGTTIERYQAHEIALRTGISTLNEVRDLEHRPRFDAWADEPFAAAPSDTTTAEPPTLTVVEGEGESA